MKSTIERRKSRWTTCRYPSANVLLSFGLRYCWFICCCRPHCYPICFLHILSITIASSAGLGMEVKGGTSRQHDDGSSTVQKSRGSAIQKRYWFGLTHVQWRHAMAFPPREWLWCCRCRRRSDAGDDSVYCCGTADRSGVKISDSKRKLKTLCRIGPPDSDAGRRTSRPSTPV